MIPRWGIFALALSLAPSPVAAQARGDETQIRLLQAEQAGHGTRTTARAMPPCSPATRM